MEGKRGVFALPGNGSGTNRLGGWLNVLAEAATGIDLMGNTVGGQVSISVYFRVGEGWRRGT